MINYNRLERTAKHVCSRLPPSVDWQDLAQESAMAALRGRQSAIGPMIDWLRTKAAVVKTARNKQYPQREYVRCVPLNSGLSIPGHELATIMRLDALTMLTKLSERKEMILTLSYWGGLNNREIAEAFGITEGRVCMQKQEALAKLREIAA